MGVTYKRPPGRPKGVPVLITDEWRVKLDAWLSAFGRGSQKNLAIATGTSTNTIGEIRRGVRKGVDEAMAGAIARHTGLEPPGRSECNDGLGDVIEALRAAVEVGASPDDLRSLAAELHAFANEAKKLESMKSEYEDRRRALTLRFPKGRE